MWLRNGWEFFSGRFLSSLSNDQSEAAAESQETQLSETKDSSKLNLRRIENKILCGSRTCKPNSSGGVANRQLI
jgi:hypothetical protein